MEDRILRNWIIPLAAFRTLEGVLDLPFSYQDIRKVTLDGIVRQNAECKSNNELANFWNVVSYLQQDGEIFIEGDYRIEYVNKFKSNLIKIEQQYQEPKAILMMRKNRIFMLYKNSASRLAIQFFRKARWCTTWRTPRNTWVKRTQSGSKTYSVVWKFRK